MRETEKISKLLEKLGNGNNWTGINAAQVFEGISEETALKKFHPGHLNIAELTAHLVCWNKTLVKWLHKENYKATPQEDFPVIETLTAEEWEALKRSFFDSLAALAKEITQKEDSMLDERLFEDGSIGYRVLHGQIAHLHYHLGQVVLLRKIFIATR